MNSSWLMLLLLLALVFWALSTPPMASTGMVHSLLFGKGSQLRIAPELATVHDDPFEPDALRLGETA